MRLIFEALDVLFFRDARAFGAGADHVAQSVLPPPPTTIQGALRTWLGWQQGWRPGKPLPEGLGDENELGKLRIRGPFVGRTVNGSVITRHPVPADACSFKLQSGNGNSRILVTQRKPIFPTSTYASWLKSDLGAGPLKVPLLWPRPPDGSATQEELPAALEMEDLINYLLGQPIALTQKQFDDLRGFGLGLAEQEPRIGIGLSTGRRTAFQGLFYTAQFARLKESRNAVLVADVFGGGLSFLKQKAEDVLTLGGESRLAKFTALDDYNWAVDKVSDALAGVNTIKLYALSCLPVGSRPHEVVEGINIEHANLAGRRIRIIGIAAQRPIRISGFDVKNKRPRQSFLAWPPGTVLYLQLEDGDCDTEFVSRVHGQSILQFGSWEEQIGLGQVLVGKFFE